MHLELRTAQPATACRFYRRLFGWRAEMVHLCGASYISLGLGALIDGGVVEEPRSTPSWMPYVGVTDIAHATAHAERLGAVVVLEPREGPVGWRSVISAPDGAQIALWQQKIARVAADESAPPLAVIEGDESRDIKESDGDRTFKGRDDDRV